MTMATENIRFIMRHDIVDPVKWKPINELENLMEAMTLAWKADVAGLMGICTDSPDVHFCLWECAPTTTPENACRWMDVEGKSEGIAKNSAIVVNSTKCMGYPPPIIGQPPVELDASMFPATKGTFAFVHHKVKDKAAFDARNESLFTNPNDYVKPHKEHGFAVHIYMPTEKDLYALWEISKGNDKKSLQKYLDENIFSSDLAENVVYLCNDTSAKSIGLPLGILD
eukprot:GEMP01047481.1.p1 GENE.GEMP01047481.1~~GEMP01047481.1.p1  ORF type:complete len:226 (+),score=47.45 GEMP01047481.1:85-762(+)